MSKITAELFSTLDGIVSRPDQWHGPYFDEAAGSQTEDLLAASDVMLLGGNTYDEHAGYWPTAEGRMADLMNSIPKAVVTTRTEPLTWQNSTQLTGDVPAAIRALAETSERGVVVTGSVALVKSLLADDLLDELRLIVDPIVAGSGTRLFDEAAAARVWTLTASEEFSTGAVTLTYARVR